MIKKRKFTVQEKRFEDLKKELDVHLKKLDEIMSADFKAFNDKLDSEGVSRIIIPKRWAYSK